MVRKIDTLFVSIIILFIFSGLVLHLSSLKLDYGPEEQPALPRELDIWKLEKKIDLPQVVFKILQTQTVVLGEYRNPQQDRLHLYILKSSSRRSSFHQPEYCYLGTGENELLKSGLLNIKLDTGDSVKVNYLFLQKPEGFEVVCYFYTANELIIPSYYQQQLYFLAKRIKNQKVEGALYRLAKFCKQDEFDAELQNMQLIVEALLKNI